MAKKKSPALVIDADIARSSSKSPKPTPQHCRAFLHAVANHSYYLVMSPDLIAEWNKHQSRFTRKWRRKMYGRKRVMVVRPEYDEKLYKRIEEAAESVRQRHAIFKDFHLVEAALATDQRIASMDEKMRRLLSIAALEKAVKELRAIMWVNPDKPEEQAVAWLENGACYEKERCLGYEKEE